MRKALKNTYEELNSAVSFQKSELVASIFHELLVPTSGSIGAKRVCFEQ